MLGELRWPTKNFSAILLFPLLIHGRPLRTVQFHNNIGPIRLLLLLLLFLTFERLLGEAIVQRRSLPVFDSLLLLVAPCTGSFLLLLDPRFLARAATPDTSAESLPDQKTCALVAQAFSLAKSGQLNRRTLEAFPRFFQSHGQHISSGSSRVAADPDARQTVRYPAMAHLQQGL